MKKKLLLLHGALGSAQQFDELGLFLENDFEVHTINFSGHGGNRIQSPFSIKLFAHEVLSYMNSQQIDDIDIFGYSMGGYVALHVALNHPSRVKRIMTLGTKFNWTPESAEKEVKMLSPQIIEEKLPSFAETLRSRHAPESWENVMLETARMMMALGNGDALTEADFNKIHHEVLICVGSEDKMVTGQESRNAAASLSNGRFKSIPGFKHPIDMVDHQILGKLIADFFG